MLILPATQLLNPDGYPKKEFTLYSIYTLDGEVSDLFMYGTDEPFLEIQYQDGRLDNPADLGTLCLLSEYEIFPSEVEYHLKKVMASQMSN